MPPITITALRQRFQTLYDVEGSTVLTAVDGGEVDQLINDGYRALWAEVIAVNKDFRVTPSTFTLAPGTYAQPLPSDFLEVRFVRRDPGTAQQVFLNRFDAKTAGAMNERSYRLQGTNLVIEPIMNAAGFYSLDYVPQCPLLANASPNVDAELNQFQDFIVYHAVIAALGREESDPSTFVLLFDGNPATQDPGARGRVRRWASDQRSADPDTVVDVRGRSAWAWGPP